MSLLQRAARYVVSLAGQEFGPKLEGSTKVSSGTDIVGGRMDYESTDALRGSRKWATLDAMENDPKIKQALNANILPLLTSDWSFVAPGKDGERDPLDEEFAELCNANILDKSGERFGEQYFNETPWRAQRLPERLRMLRDGFAAIVTTSKTVDGPGGFRRVYARTQWVEPHTLDDSSRPWQIDGDGRITGLRRTYFDPEMRMHVDELIPADRLKLYVWEMLGERFEGRQFIRSMFGPWFRKDFKQKRALLWVQKAAAAMPYGVHPENYVGKNLERFEESVRAMRGTATDTSWASLPMGPNGEIPLLKYASADGDDVGKMEPLIAAENHEISLAGATGSRDLGLAGNSGNRALGEVQGRVEALQQESIETVLATWITFGAGNLEGEVRELRRWNYPDTVRLPILTSTKLDPFAGINNSSDVIAGWREKILPHTAEVRRQFATMHGFKIEDESVFEIDDDETPQGGPVPLEPVDALPSTPDGAGPPPTKPDDAGGDEPDAADDDEANSLARLAARDDFRRSISDLLEIDGGARRLPGSFRKPTRLEVEFVNLAEISQTQADGEAAAAAVLIDATRDMRADLLDRFEAGKVTLRNLDGLKRSRPKGERVMRGKLGRELGRTGRQGARQVEDELARQLGPVTDEISLGISEVELLAFGEDIEARAVISIDEIWKRELGVFLESWDDARRRKLLPPDMARQLEQALAGLSDKPVAAVGRRASTVAYNKGRGAEINSFDARTPGPQFVVRSEVLDTGTCRPCGLLDSKVFEIGTADYFANEPPAQCDGGTLCRGFYVAIGGRRGS